MFLVAKLELGNGTEKKALLSNQCWVYAAPDFVGACFINFGGLPALAFPSRSLGTRK
jgi:hypothetical protein